MITIIKANSSHISKIAPLLNQYRIFYRQESDIEAAKTFLENRISRDESIIFLAFDDDDPVGFTQLYTTFSSVSLQPSLILNDLYVSDKSRNRGVGKALLNKAKDFCKEMRYKGLALETAVDNPAQQLYEKLGWEKDSDCFHYFWTSK